VGLLYSTTSVMRRARITLVVIATWLGFSALQMSVGAALAKSGDVKWGRELLVDVTMALYWSFVTLPIALWHRRLRASGRGIVQIVALHLPLLFLVVVGDTYSSRAAVYLFTGAAPVARAIATITYFADFDTLSYLAVVLVTDALIAREAVRAHERREARLGSLLARARLEYLEAQLQPHFLFNALGAVSELAYEAPQTALRVLRQLALIFRGALTARPGEVTLGEELVAIEPYLDIQRLRFPDWLRISYDVAGDTLDCLVPRFVLQPLVENAIRHGLTGRVAAGCMEISSRIAGGRLILRVADNGVGLRQVVTRPGYGIGLTNVRERLATLYGAGEQLRLFDAPGGGAVAEVELPARRATEHAPRNAVLPDDPFDRAPDEPLAPAPPSGAPSRSAHVARALAIWIACGLLWTVQSYAYLTIRNRLGQYTFFTLAQHDVAVALLWAAIAPLVMAVTSRFPFTTARRLLRAGAYLIGMGVIAVGHQAILGRVFTPRLRLWSAANTNIFILNFLVLAVLVALGHRRQLTEWMRERALSAAALASELDTARLRAARLQEIPPAVLKALDRVIETVSARPTPSPRRTEQLLARLGDYLRVAIECSDEEGITPSREQSLARSLAHFERAAAVSATPTSLSSS
jgi:two-component system LytT family sensor kinase